VDRRNNYPRRPNIRSAARPSYDGRPLPAEVYYRRRRLAALFALLVVIGVVATLLFIRSNHESATVAVTEPIASTPRATGGAPATPTGSPKATSVSGGGAGSEPAAEVARLRDGRVGVSVSGGGYWDHGDHHPDAGGPPAHHAPVLDHRLPEARPSTGRSTRP